MFAYRRRQRGAATEGGDTAQGDADAVAVPQPSRSRPTSWTGTHGVQVRFLCWRDQRENHSISNGDGGGGGGGGMRLRAKGGDSVV